MEKMPYYCLITFSCTYIWMQVFPLLMQKFSSTEQAQLVWRYMCSVPIILLEEFLPWMTTSLSSNEQLDVISCIEVIVPKERLLQEVSLSLCQMCSV